MDVGFRHQGVPLLILRVDMMPGCTSMAHSGSGVHSGLCVIRKR